MDHQRERIQADLRGLIAGEVHCSDPYVQMYSTDGSIYQVPPLGVVRPRGQSDVQQAVRYAAEQSIPIHARGAGTGLAGESLGPGLAIDFSTSMRRIVSVDGDTVTVQPGVVLGQLNRYLAAFGKQFGPDPATGGVTTLGSVLALDNSGSHWLRYGSARRQAVSLQVVLADGESFEASRHPVTDDPLVDPIPRRREIVRRLADLIQREESVIKAHRPKSLVNRAGYHLHDVLSGGQLDLAKVLVGSEGTLALFTQATVRTQPIPRYRGLVLMFFEKLEAAAAAAQDAVEMKLAACDLMDRRILSLARDHDPRYASAIPRDAEAMLMVEQQADEQRDVIESLQLVAMRWQRKRRLAFSFHLALAPEEYDLFRRLARRVSPTLYRVPGPERPVPFVEDIAVPPAVLPDFLVKMQKILQSHQVTASFFAHAGHGQLHIRPFLNLADPKHQQTMQALAGALYEEVMAVGGTISGEHGCGLSRTWYVKRQFGPLYDVFREVKRIFDPANLLNPGKVVADVPQPLTKNLRPAGEDGMLLPTERNAVRSAVEADSLRSGQEPDAAHAPSIAQADQASEVDSVGPGEPAKLADKPMELHLVWQGDLAATANLCNGCGRCRTQSPDARMCPIFRIAPAEEASPRAKANLIRGIISGGLDANELTQDTLKSLADLCVNCHQCRLECPAGVDIPKLMIEAKAQYVASNGIDMTDWIVTRLDMVSRWASFLAPLSNWALHNRTMRWLIEKTVGIAQGRKLPRIASSTFLRRAERLRLTKPTRRTGGKVLYFVDLYANWFDVQLAEAFVAVMQHHGISVYVHPHQRASGMAKIAVGDVERAKVTAARNVALLAESIRQGYEIVATEPSAVLCLTHEYRHLLDDDDVKLVAEHTSDACAYLWRLHEAGKLELDFRPINLVLGYHTPCHLKALDTLSALSQRERESSAGERLLNLVPGLTVRHIERGCSGMAGTYGLKRANYRSSLRAGWGLIRALRDPAIDLGTTECSACKIQMEQGTTKPTIHPIKILALAYGLMPEIADLIAARGQELTVT